ncbi:MAG: hypothetical protein EOP19_05665 [Hyphomicrobiales bacterium]|nr:MAG: hypothetical protein EOP19_05665 [Hyphomicrobiales bacterium]
MNEPGSKVEFAPWPTVVANDDVELLELKYEAVERRLEAVLQRGGGRIVARFSDVEAFRVLDEGGLTQLWAASEDTPRPTHTTFRVRGHRWTAESEIIFHLGTSDGWSYVIATGDDCIEVLTRAEPLVEHA